VGTGPCAVPAPVPGAFPFLYRLWADASRRVACRVKRWPRWIASGDCGGAQRHHGANARRRRRHGPRGILPQPSVRLDEAVRVIGMGRALARGVGGEEEVADARVRGEGVSVAGGVGDPGGLAVSAVATFAALRPSGLWFSARRRTGGSKVGRRWVESGPVLSGLQFDETGCCRSCPACAECGKI